MELSPRQMPRRPHCSSIQAWGWVWKWPVVVKVSQFPRLQGVCAHRAGPLPTCSLCGTPVSGWSSHAPLRDHGQRLVWRSLALSPQAPVLHKGTAARWIPSARLQAYGVNLAAVVGFDGVRQGWWPQGLEYERHWPPVGLISKGSHKNQPLSLSWGEGSCCHVRGFKTQRAGGGVHVGVGLRWAGALLMLPG